MLRSPLYVFTALIALSLIACSDAGNQAAAQAVFSGDQAQESNLRLQALKKEYAALLNELESQVPSSQWSEVELQDYASELDRLEAMEKELLALAKPEGDLQSQSYLNPFFIANRRALIDKARQEMDYVTLVGRFNRLFKVISQEKTMLAYSAYPDETWSVDELLKHRSRMQNLFYQHVDMIATTGDLMSHDLGRRMSLEYESLIFSLTQSRLEVDEEIKWTIYLLDRQTKLL